MSMIQEKTCPNCGGSMLAENDDDEYCLSCIHEERV